ncbi:hypothetical protein VX037_18425 [Gordonia sp. Z-3]|jgi:hypothetical protein|uniref:Uncharacterized protein n=2 Tax=Gordonia TaxID=2053 RepID=A0A9X3D822_9ACTN|nr:MULTISPECIES: hypothetical protein [Gordonia]MCF3937208.1 hypothetical protein [Gordonia tangerina]MCX2965689.1 hypothetical protein [Gordonia aquimaris]MED5803005.1 hypothetical protein [Gordonia sp. Z-3]
MSDFINKIKEEAKAFSAAVDQELTVLEGVDGYDPLRDEDERSDDDNTADEADTPSDDTEGGGTPVKE